MPDNEKFASLRTADRSWAVAAIHGEAERLRALHAVLEARVRVGENLVYLGNVLGRGGAVTETVHELLLFRRRLLSRRGVFRGDVAYLRGSQEEMWHKLLQIQFAPNPSEVLKWMLDQGIGPTLAAYDGSAEKGLEATRNGAMALTNWTTRLREAIRARDGHNALMSALRRAAYVEDESLLFVHAGIDPTRPLSEQTDSFWWGGLDFDGKDATYEGFRRVVRGLDPRHRGVAIGDVTATIDGGCGFGGPLVAACFNAGGELVDMIEA